MSRSRRAGYAGVDGGGSNDARRDARQSGCGRASGSRVRPTVLWLLPPDASDGRAEPINRATLGTEGGNAELPTRGRHRAQAGAVFRRRRRCHAGAVRCDGRDQQSAWVFGSSGGRGRSAHSGSAGCPPVVRSGQNGRWFGSGWDRLLPAQLAPRHCAFVSSRSGRQAASQEHAPSNPSQPHGIGPSRSSLLGETNKPTR
jgi:hypothetical protein